MAFVHWTALHFQLREGEGVSPPLPFPLLLPFTLLHSSPIPNPILVRESVKRPFKRPFKQPFKRPFTRQFKLPSCNKACPPGPATFVHGYNGEQGTLKRSSAETAVKGVLVSPAGNLAPGRLRHSTVRPKVDGSSSEWAIVQKCPRVFGMEHSIRPRCATTRRRRLHR